MALNLSRPVHQLDPLSPDLHEDAVKMREHGPIVPIALPGGVPMWGVAGDEAGRNLLKVNGKTVLNAVELNRYDIISIGTTKLMFVPLCGEHFSWKKE